MICGPECRELINDCILSSLSFARRVSDLSLANDDGTGRWNGTVGGVAASVDDDDDHGLVVGSSSRSVMVPMLGIWKYLYRRMSGGHAISSSS